MRKEVISDRQGICTIILFIIGSSSVFTMGLEAKQDLWLAIILGLAFALPFAILNARLHYLFPNKNLFDIVEICFGKLLGKLIILFFISYTFYWAPDVATNYGEFIRTVSFPTIPKIVPMGFIIILCSFAIRQGIELLGRYSELVFKIPVLILIASTIFLIPRMHITNLQPYLSNGFKPIFTAAFGLLSFPFGQLAASFTIAFSSFKYKYSPYKVYLYGLIIGALLLLISSLNNILVLGVNAASLYQYPSYITATKIHINLLERVEALVAITFIFGGFVKISILMLCTCKGIAKIFEINDYRFIVLPITLLTINIAYFQYESILHYSDFTTNIWPYYVLPYQTLLPIPIWILAEIKSRKLRNN